MRKPLIGISAALIAAAGALAQGPTYIHDLNSRVEFTPGGPDGQLAWWVNDVNYLAKQWFWFRVGGEDREYSIDTLLMPNPPKLLDTNFNPGDDLLSLRYEDPVRNFRIDLAFLLTGAPAGTLASDIAETIIITNPGTTPLDFHFFQYVDLNLGGQSPDTARYMNDNAVRQTSTLGHRASETVITPAASHREIDFVPNTLSRLNDALPTTLNDFTGPLTGDVSWAYQWDTVIAPGKAFLISKDKQNTPQPPTKAMQAQGGLVLKRRRRPA